MFCRYDVYVNLLFLIKSTVHGDVNVVGGGKRFVGNINLLRRVCSRRETESGRNRESVDSLRAQRFKKHRCVKIAEFHEKTQVIVVDFAQFFFCRNIRSFSFRLRFYTFRNNTYRYPSVEYMLAHQTSFFKGERHSF